MIAKRPKRGHGFGRLKITDLRDHRFLASRYLAADARTDGIQMWKPGPVMDQGQTSQCTAYSAAGLLECDPVINMTHPDPAELYRLNQDNDEWPGNNYDGSSVRASMKVLQMLGYLTEYAWAFNVTQTVQWILNKGPVTFGTIWPDSMMEPDANGFLMIGPDGPVGDGGHAYMIYGVDTTLQCPDGTTGAFYMQNSWSDNWGEGGRAKIPFSTAKVLISEGGEVSMPVEQLENPTPIVPPAPPAPVAPDRDAIIAEIYALGQQTTALIEQLR